MIKDYRKRIELYAKFLCEVYKLEYYFKPEMNNSFARFITTNFITTNSYLQKGKPKMIYLQTSFRRPQKAMQLADLHSFDFGTKVIFWVSEKPCNSFSFLS